MQITITPSGIQALVAALALLAAANAWVTKAMIAAELKKLNGRYLYANGVQISGHEIERRLQNVESGPCKFHLLRDRGEERV